MKRNRLLLAAFALLLINGCRTPQSVLINPVNVQRHDGSPVRHYLQLRDSRRHSEKLFLVLQGSDCNSVRHIPLVEKLKGIYPAADILTIEKYGITDALSYSMVLRETLPEGYLEFDNPRQRAFDAKKVLSALIEKYGYGRVLVFGGSEGATVAYLLASGCDYVDATITLGGGGQFFTDDVITTIMATGAPENEKEREVEGFREFAQYILSQDDIVDFCLSDHGFRYWKTMLSLDQKEIISGINTPLLILQGGKDQAASPEKTTQMVDELKRSGKDNIDYFLYTEYDHSLNLSTDREAYKKVMDDIQQWLRKTL